MRLHDARSSPFLYETKNYSFNMTSSNASDLYSGAVRFEYPFRHRLFRDFFVVFLSSTMQVLQ